MIMLDDLKGVLDEIEKANEWEHGFVQDMLIRFEEDPDYKLINKQFKKLHDIHQRYVKYMTPWR